jgi:glycine cleavage system H protein
VEAGQAWIGVTDYARQELGDVDYVELPNLEDRLSKNRAFGIIETSKAVTDLVAPISGLVVEVNTALAESPEGLTDDPYGDGWLVAVEPSDPDELDELMNADAYEELLRDEADT